MFENLRGLFQDIQASRFNVFWHFARRHRRLLVIAIQLARQLVNIGCHAVRLQLARRHRDDFWIFGQFQQQSFFSFIVISISSRLFDRFIIPRDS